MVQTVQFFEKMQDLLQKRIPFVLVTLVEVRVSAPQEPGAKILVTNEGLYGGTVGGGKLEAAAIEYSQKLLTDRQEPTRELRVWNLSRDIGMTCGGEVSLFFETFGHRIWTIAVFGAGHVAQSLIPILIRLDCQIKCIDHRQEWLDRLPDTANLKKILADPMENEVTKLEEDDFVISLTQGHAFDLPIVARLLMMRQPKYLGVIGSPAKARTLKRHLQEQGIAQDRLDQIRCPIGLKIGSRDPSEIAISIAAELIQVRDQIYAARPEQRSKLTRMIRREGRDESL